MAEQRHIVFPKQLISSVDLSRTIRELQALDESLRQTQLRKPGEPTKLSRSSLTLEDMARLNDVSLLDERQREQLIALLQALLEHSPRIHMSVAAEPSGQFVQNITAWMRQKIHPTILVEVGLQPTLAAGCMIRTTNKVFDMSLRNRLAESRSLLSEKIGDVASSE